MSNFSFKIGEDEASIIGVAGQRLAMRLMIEYTVGVCSEMIRLFESFDRGVILLVLLRQTVRHESKGDDENVQEKGISINALSASLNRPFETVRRKVHELIDEHICDRTDSGIVLSQAVLKSAAMQQFRTAVQDMFVRLVDDMRDSDIPFPPARGASQPSPESIVLVAIDMFLSHVEFGSRTHQDWIKMLLYAAIMAGSVRAITYDPVLTKIYSDASTPPPAAIRRSISVSGLVHGLGLPEATVRRHLKVLIDDNKLTRDSHGVMISTASLMDPDLLAQGAHLTRRMNKMIAHLATIGFPFDDPKRCYRDGRPPLVNFD
jgi:hypothetical protein